MDKPCYQNAWWTFAKENPLWRTSSSQRSHGGQKKWYKDTLKTSFKDFNIPTESWEQIAQDRTKWQGLIKRGAGEYEAKGISEAEQKRVQRKVRAKASPTELSCSDLSCSICSRQFRAKIGLISHLRTHNINTSHSWLGLVIVSNDRRTREKTCDSFKVLAKKPKRSWVTIKKGTQNPTFWPPLTPRHAPGQKVCTTIFYSS